MVVNWHNGKAFGILEDQSLQAKGAPAFFMGTVSGASLTDILVFGTDAGDPNIPTDRISAFNGTGTGSFTGTNFDIFTASSTGAEYSPAIPGNPLTGDWDVNISGLLAKQEPTAPTGSENWAGFAVGISENVNAPDVERKIFMNNFADAAAEQFTLAINKDSGTVTGALKAPQINRVSATTYGSLDLQIGGAFGSTYINNKGLAALMGCTGNCINDDSIPNPIPNATLNPCGNYLIVEAPDYQFSDYATWGFWEVSHQEADGADPDFVADMYHTHAPYSMWIAGQKTPATFVADLINATSFVGRYEGMAQGTVIDFLGNAFPLTNGQSSLASISAMPTWLRRSSGLSLSMR